MRSDSFLSFSAMGCSIKSVTATEVTKMKRYRRILQDLPGDFFRTPSRNSIQLCQANEQNSEIADKARISIWNDEVMHWISQQINLHGVISQELQQTL